MRRVKANLQRLKTGAPRLRMGAPYRKAPGPPGWGLGVGLTTPPYKKKIVTKAKGKNAGLISRRRHLQAKKDNDFKLSSWNVRTLHRSGALKSLLDSVNKYKIDIIALQEIRWTGCNIIQKKTHTVFYSCHPKNHILGTGFIVNRRTGQNVIDFEACSPRLCKLRIRSKFFNYSIINAHAPTEEKTETEKEEFYNELESMLLACPKHDIKIVLGDMNAKVGQEKQYYPTIGRNSLHKESNDNGTRLIHFAASQNMVITGTWFEHKDIHKGTWKSPDSNTVNMIDHILIDSRHFSNVLDVRNRRAANIDSDHFLLEARLRARISNAKKSMGNKKNSYNTNKLQDEEQREKYEKKLQEKLKDIQSSDPFCISQKWKQCRQILEETADEILEKNKGLKHRTTWFDEECAQITDKKNAIYKKLQQRQKTRQLENDYKKLRREEKKIHRRKKREYMRQEMEELENLNSQAEARKFYQKINRGRKEFQPRTNMCRDKNGNIVSKKEEILERWAENFEEKLNEGKKDKEGDNIILNDNDKREKEPPSLEEVKCAINKLKNNKAPGADHLPAELFKHGGQALLETLQELIKNIWTQNVIPEDWNLGVLIPIHKKGDLLQCENYRGITLLNIAYKILANIIYHRLAPYVDNIIGSYQCGFCSGRSTTDQIFTIRQILEKANEYRMETHHLFIDFKSAYDTVDRNALYKTMNDFGIPTHLIAITKTTLANVECQIRIQGDVSRIFKTHTGLRQGDPLSSILFNIALEKIIRDTNITTTGTIMNRRTQILAFADDIDIIARTKREMIQAFLDLDKCAKEFGLQINANKTKYMQTGIKNNTSPSILAIGDYQFEAVETFVYLGSLVTISNDTKAEINRRIHLANKTYFGLCKHLKSDMLSRNTKCKIYKTLIRPVLTYASETWVMTQNDERTLGTFERKVLRHIYRGIQENGEWRRRYNFELYQAFDEPDVVSFIKKGRLRWIGHVIRMADTTPTKQIIRQQPPGRRTKGRPKKRYMDQIEEDAKKLKINNWKTKAQNRADWKKLLKQVKTL